MHGTAGRVCWVCMSSALLEHAGLPQRPGKGLDNAVRLWFDLEHRKRAIEPYQGSSAALHDALHGDYTRRRSFRHIVISLLLALTLVLAACGGGGGGSAGGSSGGDSGGSGGTGSGGSGGSSGSGATGGVPVLTAAGNAVSVTAGPTDPTPGPQVNLSIANPPTGGLYYATSFSGSAVASANIIWSPTLANGAQSGALELMLAQPAFIGSGTFHDTVIAYVCTDSQCAHQIAGSPVTVAVTYIVTGNAVSDAGYAISPTVIALEAPTNGAAPSTTVNVTAYNVPPYGAYVFHTSQSGGPVATMSFTQTSASAAPYAYGTGVLTVNMKAPATLGPGVYSDLITLSICYDSACTKPAVGTPYEIPVTYTVTASAGQEFQQQIIQENLTALAVDPTGTILYGTTAPGDPTAPTVSSAQLVQINPGTGAVTPLLTLPAAVGQIVVSADGAYLYLVTGQLAPPSEVIRVRTTDMTIDQTVTLTTSFVEPIQVAVSPINSNTWSAAFSPTGNVWNVEIFDGTVARPNSWSVSSDVVYGNEGLWSSDGSTMYILDANLNAVPVSTSGLGGGTQLQPGSSAQSGFDFGGLQLAGGLLYSGAGQVLNPLTNTLVGQYTLPGGVPYADLTIDTANNRMFATFTGTVNDAAEGTIQSYNLTTFSPVWIARLPIGTQPLRWGSNGLAWLGPSNTAGAQALYLINGTFVAP
jgi:hypothetical protein